MASEYALYIAAYNEYLRVKAGNASVAPPVGPAVGTRGLVSGGYGTGRYLSVGGYGLAVVRDGSRTWRQGVVTGDEGVGESECRVESVGEGGSKADESGGGGPQISGGGDGTGVRSTSASSEVKLESVSVGSRGKHWERNREWKQEKKARKLRRKELDAASWRRAGEERVSSSRSSVEPLAHGSGAPSLSASVVTVDSRTAEEIEASRTLALRRTVENKLAIARGKYQLASFADKDKTEAIKRLEVARIEERINTTKAKSQASYKKCDTPLNSVGSAGSAGEFAWKQEIRKRDALQKKSDYFEQQLELAMKYLPDAGKRAIAELPEPYIPTLEDIEFEDAEISPYYSREEMEAEAAKWVGDEAW